MPRDKDLKRIIRARMQKTGEAYTTARAHTIKKSATKKTVQTPAPDYAAIGGKSDAIMKTKTGRDWAQWVRTLDKASAHKLTHTEIARMVHDEYDIDGWWAQTVTVGYERIKGLRDIGQRRDGAYEANKSKTVNVPVAVLFDAWARDAMRQRWLTGVNPVVRTATKARSMRLGMPDGTIAAIGFAAKGAEKSSVSVQHMKLPDRAAAAAMKAFWGERLNALAELLHGKQR